MKLFLASEAKNPAAVEKLKAFVGKPIDELNLVYIPTAANGGGSHGMWKLGDGIKVATSLNPNLKIVELEEYAHTDVLKEIRGADIIWFAGGMAGYLAYWMRRLSLDKALPDILARGGALCWI